MLKKMTVKQSLTSKGMLSGYGMVILGGYLIYKGQFELGIAQITTGLGILGIRDAVEPME